MTHPDDRTENVDIDVGKDDSFTVRFVPVMNGIHTLSVKKDDEDVQGKESIYLCHHIFTNRSDSHNCI